MDLQPKKSGNEKLLIGLVLGIILGFIFYWVSQIVPHSSETIFLFLISLLFFCSLLFLVIIWFRKTIIKKIFGRNYEFHTIVNDTQETLNLFSKNIISKFPMGVAERERFEFFLPKIINYIIWSNFRNWAFKIIISFVIGLGGIVSTILILNQNKLFEIQNKRIEQQTYLIEAERRSSQVFLISDVLSDLSSDLRANKVVSEEVLGRVIGLTKSMKPYKYLSNDSLISNILSPEKGQLFISLIHCGLDSTKYNELLQKCDFSFAEISNLDLSYTNLIGCNFQNANFNNCNLTGAKFNDGNFSYATFKNTVFGSPNSKKTDFGNCDLTGANFENSSLMKVNMKGAKLIGANFKGANILGVNLSEANLNSINFKTNYVDLIQVERYDWLNFIKDSLGIMVADDFYKKYKVVGSLKMENEHLSPFFVLRKEDTLFNLLNKYKTNDFNY